MKSMKERITIICIISILLCALSSVAFSTSEGTAENIISFGRLKIQLINNRMDENGEEVSVTTEEEKLNGNQVSRIIKVKNICDTRYMSGSRLSLAVKINKESFRRESMSRSKIRPENG